MAVDMFMKINGVDGESTDAKRKGDIEVLAWSWGMSQSGTMHAGTGGGSGKVSVQDLSFTKYVDKASTVLMMACAKGTHFDTAELRVRKAGDTPLDYITINLKNVLITSLSTGGSGGEDRLTENVTLNFSQFDVQYQAQNAKGGKEGGGVHAKFDIAANKPL
jgi:type VI secretion system secreted protein Hcp